MTITEECEPMPDETQLDRIERKLELVLELENRIVKLEMRVDGFDSTTKEIATFRGMVGVVQKIDSLQGRVDVLEKSAERRAGTTDGIKMVWMMLAGFPGMIALAALMALLSRLGASVKP